MKPQRGYLNQPPPRVVGPQRMMNTGKKTLLKRIAAGVVFTLMAITIIVLAINLAMKDDGDAGDTPPPPPPSATVTQAANTVCPEGLPTIKYVDDRGSNTEYKALLDGTKTVKEFNAGLREWPQYLAYRASNPQLTSVRRALKQDPAEIWGQNQDWKQLVNEEKTCLNEKGLVVLHQITETYDLAVANENSQVPADWCNTGVGPNGTVENTTCGIPEDKRAAIEFAWPGTNLKDYSMHHCGNFGVNKPGTFTQVHFTPPPPVATKPPPPPVITSTPPPPNECTECCEDTCVTTTQPPPPPTPKDPNVAPGCSQSTGSGGPGGCQPRPTTPKPETTWTPEPSVYVPPPPPPATTVQAPTRTVAPAPVEQQPTVELPAQPTRTEAVEVPTDATQCGDPVLCG